MSYEDGPEPVAEWEATAFCFDCEKVSDHAFIEWRGPGHTVTSECAACGDVREIEDDGR